MVKLYDKMNNNWILVDFGVMSKIDNYGKGGYLIVINNEKCKIGDKLILKEEKLNRS